MTLPENALLYHWPDFKRDHYFNSDTSDTKWPEKDKKLFARGMTLN